MNASLMRFCQIFVLFLFSFFFFPFQTRNIGAGSIESVLHIFLICFLSSLAFAAVVHPSLLKLPLACSFDRHVHQIVYSKGGLGYRSPFQ